MCAAASDSPTMQDEKNSFVRNPRIVNASRKSHKLAVSSHDTAAHHQAVPKKQSAPIQDRTAAPRHLLDRKLHTPNSYCIG